MVLLFSEYIFPHPFGHTHFSAMLLLSGWECDSTFAFAIVVVAVDVVVFGVVFPFTVVFVFVLSEVPVIMTGAAVLAWALELGLLTLSTFESPSGSVF